MSWFRCRIRSRGQIANVCGQFVRRSPHQYSGVRGLSGCEWFSLLAIFISLASNGKQIYLISVEPRAIQCSLHELESNASSFENNHNEILHILFQSSQIFESFLDLSLPLNEEKVRYLVMIFYAHFLPTGSVREKGFIMGWTVWTREWGSCFKVIRVAIIMIQMREFFHDRHFLVANSSRAGPTLHPRPKKTATICWLRKTRHPHPSNEA